MWFVFCLVWAALFFAAPQAKNLKLIMTGGSIRLGLIGVRRTRPRKAGCRRDLAVGERQRNPRI